jgi:hypothetical protein
MEAVECSRKSCQDAFVQIVTVFHRGAAMKSRFQAAAIFLTLFLAKGAYAQDVYYLPHIANGNFGAVSFRTTFILFNNSDAGATATLSLTDDGGSPLTTTIGGLGTGSQFIINLDAGATGILVTDGLGNGAVGAATVTLALTKDNGSPFIVTIPGSGPGTGTNSSFSLSLAAGASVFLQTDGLGAGTSGAATITSNVPVGASAIFTVLDSRGQFQTEAGVGDSAVLTSLTLPVDVTGNSNTGIAFFNPGGGSVVLTFKLLDATGVLVDSSTASLASSNHLARFVTELFPAISAFRGSLAVSAAGGVAATTLRQYGAGTTYTTLPTVRGTATGKAPITPLLSKTVTGISAVVGDPDVAISDRLLPGSLISGSISGAGRGLQVVASAGGNNVYSSQVNPLTGKYLIVLPDGTYNLTAYSQPTGAPDTMAVTVAYADPNPVQVVFDAVRDVNLPAVTLFDVLGSVSGLSNLPSAAGAAIVFTSNDNKMQGQFTLDPSGSYQGVLPAGNYLACVSSGSLQLYNVGSLVVGGGPATGNYAIPVMATLSGTVRGGNLLTIPPGTIVTAADASAPAIAGFTCCAPPAASTAIPDSSGRYQLVLARNRSFVVGVTAPLVQGTNVMGTIYYPLSSSAVSLAGDAALDFSVPTLLLRVVIYGTVKDSTSNALADVVVIAYSQSIAGAANTGFSVSGKTDIYGNYSITVPGGTNYRLTFVPPAPKP